MLNLETFQNGLSNQTVQFTLAVAFVTSLYRFYTTIWRPAFPDKGASLIPEGGPLFGSSRFWSARWDFFQEWAAKGKLAISFYVGKYQVINLSGEANRIAYFEDKQMDLGEGYMLLTGGRSDPIADGRLFSHYFVDCFKKILRGDQLVRNFPNLLSDLKARIDILAEDPSGVTDPFESIYEIVFQLTMRTVGCNEVADDPELVKATMSYNRMMELAGTPMAVMFPWFPSRGVLRKYYAGARMYMIFDKVAKARLAEGRSENDAMQVMLNQGDSIKNILGVVFGSLFAGQLNSGINAAWVLIYLSERPEWQQKVREQIESVAAKHCPGSPLSLLEQLCSLPMSVWETEFPLIELCLKDSIRLQIVGAAMRRNVSGHTIKVGDALVPDGAFVTFPFADVHQDENIYPEPEKWEPSRYLPERAEHTKKPYCFLGWGAGKHPCLGMRFAKMEQVLITVFWMATFDYELVDKEGRPTAKIPKSDQNGFSAHKPEPKIYFKYKLRDAK